MDDQEKRRTAKGWNDPPTLDEMKAAANPVHGNKVPIHQKYRYPAASGYGYPQPPGQSNYSSSSLYKK